MAATARATAKISKAERLILSRVSGASCTGVSSVGEWMDVRQCSKSAMGSRSNEGIRSWHLSRWHGGARWPGRAIAEEARRSRNRKQHDRRLSTDNGAQTIGGPGGGTRIFRSEKNTKCCRQSSNAYSLMIARAAALGRACLTRGSSAWSHRANPRPFADRFPQAHLVTVSTDPGRAWLRRGCAGSRAALVLARSTPRKALQGRAQGSSHSASPGCRGGYRRCSAGSRMVPMEAA